MEKETWRIIRAYPKYLISSNGRVMNSETKHILSPSFTVYGYPVVCLSMYGQTHSCQVARLVADAFLDNPLEHKYIHYRDGNPRNCSITNIYFSPYKFADLEPKGKDMRLEVR